MSTERTPGRRNATASLAGAIGRVTSILAIPYGYTVTLGAAALLSVARLGAPSEVEVLFFVLLEFTRADAHDLSAMRDKFDMIVLSDLVNDLWDVQAVLQQVGRLCYPWTLLILNFHSATVAVAACSRSKNGPCYTHAASELAHAGGRHRHA